MAAGDTVSAILTVLSTDSARTPVASFALHVDRISGGITRTPVVFGVPTVKEPSKSLPANPYLSKPAAWGLDLGMIQEYVEVSGTCDDREDDLSFAKIAQLQVLARVAGAGLFGNINSSKFGNIGAVASVLLNVDTGPNQGMALTADTWLFQGLVLSFNWTRTEDGPKLAYNYVLRLGITDWSTLIVHPAQHVLPNGSAQRSPISLDVLTVPHYDDHGNISPAQTVIATFNLRATASRGGVSRLPVYFGLPNIHDNQSDPYRTEPSAWGLDLGMIQEYVECEGICSDDEPNLQYATMTDLQVLARVAGAGLHSTVQTTKGFVGINQGGAVNLAVTPTIGALNSLSTYSSLITSLVWSRDFASFEGYSWTMRVTNVNWNGLIQPP